MTGTSPDRASAVLAAWRAIEQAATEGPWRVQPGHLGGHPKYVTAPDNSTVAECWMDDEGSAAGFIVTARTAVPALLGAIEAVLELHQPGRIKVFGYTCKSHEQHRFFSITSTEAGDVRACGQCTATVYNACTGCGPQVSVDACPVREAVTTALTGQEAGSGLETRP